MNNNYNYNNMPPQQPMYNPQYGYAPNKKNSVVMILLIVSIVICMAACLLPFLKIGDYTINYIYNEELASYGETGGIADGIFIMIFGVIAILTLLIGKKRLPAVIFQGLSMLIFVIDFISGQTSESSGLIARSYSVGFYVILIFLIISLVLSIIRLVAKDKFN